jgi:hypothetical protein
MRSAVRAHGYFEIDPRDRSSGDWGLAEGRPRRLAALFAANYAPVPVEEVGTRPIQGWPIPMARDQCEANLWWRRHWSSP